MGIGKGIFILPGRHGDARRGQMTVEFLVVLPIMIIVACIAVNAVQFFAECAAFDIAAKNAIRAYAAAPGYGQDEAAVTQQVQETLEEGFADETKSVVVERSSAGSGLALYEATLDFAPNLFGMGLRERVLGVDLPHLKHRAALAVSPYRPGIFF